MSTPDQPPESDLEKILPRLHSMEVEKRPAFLYLALARLGIEEWPPIPELALLRLEQLMDAAMEGYNPEAVDLIRELREEQERPDLEPSKSEPRHEQQTELVEKLREEGVYPVPPEITGERLTLVMGDLEAEDWHKRIPRVVRDPQKESSLAILAALEARACSPGLLSS